MSEEIMDRMRSRSPVTFERVIVYAGSFDPPAQHHVAIVRKLSELRSELLKAQPHIPVRIVVWPVGAYGTKQQVVSNEHRRHMVEDAFGAIPGVFIDDRDLRREAGYTSTYQMQNILAFEPRSDLRDAFLVPLHMPGVLRDVYHVIGADNVDAVRTWNEGHELWTRSQFIVLSREGYEPREFPRNCIVLEVPAPGSCTDIRTAIATGQPWEDLVSPLVKLYIRTHGLYGFKSVA